jgi:hypothetical protein
MITEVSTRELCEIVGLTKGRLSQLENAGVIKRAKRDRWHLAATVKALLADAHQRSAQYSETKARLEHIKWEREQIKLEQLKGRLCWYSDFEQFVDFTAASWLQALRASVFEIAGRDLTERKRVEEILGQAQDAVRSKVLAEAERLGPKKGEAA